jgi:hypothetical protein
MNSIFEVCDTLLWIYRERLGNPGFWAEPMNALSNATYRICPFLISDFAIFDAAVNRWRASSLLRLRP